MGISLMSAAMWFFPQLLIGVAPASGAVASARAKIVGPGDAPITSGDALHDPWYFNLPSRASCPGDTAKQGYLTWSYAESVGGGTAPGDITYTPGGPPPPGTSLVDINGSPYGPANTAIATSPGGPGQVGSPLPEFSWAPYVGSYAATAAAAKHAGYALHAGTWNIGIACANRKGQTTNYWNAQVRLSPPIAQGDFTWTVVSPSAAGGAPASSRPANSHPANAGSAEGTAPATASASRSAGGEPDSASPVPRDPSRAGSLANTGRNTDGLLLLGLATVAAGWALTLVARTPWRGRRLIVNRRSGRSRAENGKGRQR